ncbi:hypothetical protein FAM09_23205 [Niastella caeni]|uniref:DM13 domain-containing protein n=1 Tax=Niastella caeni TaxID=2569763 RepID=A0A4S8HM87_9BACT|nr:DM13 domain-containing protein [Niastella caeni]THU34904.1 hypothetical protein FAM09_23205 [Niastella caeni]
MKYYISIAAMMLFLIAACTKQNGSPTAPVNEMPDTTAVQTHTGSFVKGPYGTVSGMVAIFKENGKYSLALQNIMISNGPDLHVYLSKEIQPVNFIDLGKIKSIMGNQLYDISGMPDFAQYKYALIHCQQYDHLFGSAELK